MRQKQLIITIWGGSLLILAGAGMPALAQHMGTSTPHMPTMERQGAMHMEMAQQGIFTGRGNVIALVPEKQQIVVGHEAIKGFMAAMPMGMGYPVASAELLHGLQPGDQITFKIDAAKKQIIAIEKVQ